MKRVSKMKTIYYLNMTNGLEMINHYPDPHFIRIQSSHIESKAYDTLFMQLDSDFLMNLALGNCCVVIDASQKDRIPKSIRIGLPIIKYVLYRCWVSEEPLCVPLSKTLMNPEYLESIYNSLSYATKTKLKYFRKFLLTRNLDIMSYSHVTKNDGKYDVFRKLMLEVE